MDTDRRVPSVVVHLVGDRGGAPFLFAAAWSFAAGIVLFSGSLYALAVTHNRGWGAVTPFGGTCLLLGWAMLLFATLVK